MISAALPPARRRQLRRLGALGAVPALLTVVLFVLGEPRAGAVAGAASGVIAWVFCMLRIAWVPGRRRDWWGASVGLGALAAAFVVIAIDAGPSFVFGPEALLRVIAYVAIGVSLERVVSNRAPSVLATQLDAANAVLAVSALAAAFVFAPAFAWAGPDRTADAIVALTFPFLSACLVALVLVRSAQAGWRVGKAFWTLLLATWMLTVVDLCAVGRVVGLPGTPGVWTEAGQYVFAGAVSAAAWMQEPRAMPGLMRPSSSGISLPLAACAAGVVVLVAGSLGTVPAVAVWLAVATIAGGLARGVLAFLYVRRRGDERQLALSDDLTELPNRRRLQQALDESLRRGRTALVTFDLDRFKDLNSALGHAAGDALLLRVSLHLRAELRASDVGARIGADEFGIVLPNGTAEAGEALARRLLRRLAEPIVLEGVTIRVAASAGVAVADTGEAEPLMRRAAIAMRRAQSTGGTVAQFDPALDRDAGEHLRLRADLARGLYAGEVELHLQPMADIVDGHITGVEGLVRWRHPTRGLLGPAMFLSVIDGGLAAQFSRYILASAARASVALRKADHEIDVCVNLTAADVLDVALPQHLSRLLDIHGARAQDITVEVTESGVLTDMERTAANLAAIRDLGVKVALDDFGTGHSQLTHLQQLPVDVLKLDRTFVAGLDHGARNMAIVRALVRLARSLDLEVVGEGIEDAGTWRRLRTLGCNVAQGYVVSPALPLADLISRFDELEATARGVARSAGAAPVSTSPTTTTSG